MSKVIGDIDIDFPDRDRILSLISHRPASQVNDGRTMKHNVGVYVQDIPCDPTTGGATIPYKDAESLGYQKMDFINNSVYESVRDMEHLAALADPDVVQWDLLDNESFVELIPHIGKHYRLVSSICPSTVEELAIVLALIRPAKKHLVGKSLDEIRETIWNKPTDGSYYFKKAHAISYALSLVVKMNLVCSSII